MIELKEIVKRCTTGNTLSFLWLFVATVLSLLDSTDSAVQNIAQEVHTKLICSYFLWGLQVEVYEFPLPPRKTLQCFLSALKGSQKPPWRILKPVIFSTPPVNLQWGREGIWLSSFFIWTQWVVTELSRRQFGIYRCSDLLESPD